MKASKIEEGLSVLFFVNSEIRHVLIRLKNDLEYHLRKGNNKIDIREFSASLKENAEKILDLLEDEEKVEGLFKDFEGDIEWAFERDILILKELIKKILEFASTNPNSVKVSVNTVRDIEEFIEQFEEVLSREEYTERLMNEIIASVRTEWKRNIKDKWTWLYHGNSILFIPYIQRDGLDSSKLPKGIKRGIESLSKILKKYDPDIKGGFLDVDVDMDKKGVSFAWRGDNIRTSGLAVDLPAFMYELFDEEHLKRHYSAQAVLEKLNNEERKIVKIIMRFGKILRRKNKTILLRVKVDSTFIKKIGIPDFISDFDIFFSEYFTKLMNFNELQREMQGRKESVVYLCESIERTFMFFIDKVGVRDLNGARIRKNIPPEFIYLEVEGKGIIPIKTWNETLFPKII